MPKGEETVWRVSNEEAEPQRKIVLPVLRAEPERTRGSRQSGIRLAEQTALRLLQNAHIRQELAALAGGSAARTDELIAGYRKLAFGSGTDALRLLFDSVPPEDFDALDLFNVAEIKKPKDGALEIKFFDRLKALEHLETLSEADRADPGLPLYRALMRSVGTDEGSGGDETSHSLISDSFPQSS